MPWKASMTGYVRFVSLVYDGGNHTMTRPMSLPCIRIPGTLMLIHCPVADGLR